MKKIKCILMYIRMLFTLAWSGSWTPLVALLDTKKVNICRQTNKKKKRKLFILIICLHYETASEIKKARG